MDEGRQVPERRRRGVTLLLAVAAVLCVLVLLVGITWAATLAVTGLLGVS